MAVVAAAADVTVAAATMVALSALVTVAAAAAVITLAALVTVAVAACELETCVQRITAIGGSRGSSHRTRAVDWPVPQQTFLPVGGSGGSSGCNSGSISDSSSGI